MPSGLEAIRKEEAEIICTKAWLLGEVGGLLEEYAKVDCGLPPMYVLLAIMSMMATAMQKVDEAKRKGL